MRHCLVIFAVIFCLGIIFAHFFRVSFLSVFLIASAAIILSFLSLKKDLSFDFLLLCVIFILGSLSLINSKILPKYHVSNFIYYQSEADTIVGFVDSRPVYRNTKTSFIFEVKEIIFDETKLNSCGKVLVYIKGKKDLHYLDKLILRGNLYRPFDFNRNRQSSYRDYLNRKGVYAIMNVKMQKGIIKLKEHKSFSVKGFAFQLREKIENIISGCLSNLASVMLKAMILGERKIIPAAIRYSMARTGTVHILVVSGFHVGVVTFIVIVLLKFVRLPRNWRYFITVPCLIIYCLMTGAATSVVRATTMAIFFIVGLLIRRQPDIYNSLAFAAITILTLRPQQLFDIGFQLSFASVLSIIYFYPKLKNFLSIENLKIKIFRYFSKAGLVSFSAWLGTMGFIAYYFKIFSPVTVLANIFIVPLAILTILCGFSLIIIGLAIPALTPIFASTTEFSVALLLSTNSLLLKLPGAYFYLRNN